MSDEHIFLTLLGFAVIAAGHPTYLLARFAPKWTGWSYAMIIVVTAAAISLIEPTAEVFCQNTGPLVCLGPMLAVWTASATLSVTALVALGIGRWQARRRPL